MPKQSAKPAVKAVKHPKVLTKKMRKPTVHAKKNVEPVQSAEVAPRAEIPVPHKLTRQSKDTIHAIGRRKSAKARIRFVPIGNGEIVINTKPLNQFFPYFEWQKIVTQPLELTNTAGQGSFSARVVGGGQRGQAESIRLAISRVLIKINPDYKPILKSHQLLLRDSRVKERKKYGLKGARRAPQWQKR